MAYVDYWHCDVCGCKCFYDSDLQYDFDTNVEYGCGSKLYNTGDMAAICDSCSEKYEVIVKLKETN